jgi:hypothetical protein
VDGRNASSQSPRNMATASASCNELIQNFFEPLELVQGRRMLTGGNRSEPDLAVPGRVTPSATLASPPTRPPFPQAGPRSLSLGCWTVKR